MEHPELFDAVVIGSDHSVKRIEVKQAAPSTHWIWGGVRLSGSVFQQLHNLWLDRNKGDEYLGSLINAWLGKGGQALGIPAGIAYVDVGTLHGYRSAIRLLESDLSLENSQTL